MAAPARQDSKDHAIRWSREDWDRIMRAAQILTERDHVTRETTPTDVIRTGTLRFVDEVLGLPAPVASS